MTAYAPVYTIAEKIIKIAQYSLWLIPIIILYFWMIPWLKTTDWFLCHPQGYVILYKSLTAFPLLWLLSFFSNCRTISRSSV